MTIDDHDTHDTDHVSGRLVDDDGHVAYRIDGLDRMPPFLMTVVSDSDLWMFVSSTGALTAGRIDADHALFPYQTDDRIHRAAGTVGPITIIARDVDGTRALWRPFDTRPADGCRRSLTKRAIGNRLVFEEHHPGWGLTARATWAPSDRFGWVRTVDITAEAGDLVPGDDNIRLEVLDGYLDVMPAGVDAFSEQIRSNLVDAYKRSELEPASGVAVFALESPISDRAEPLEALTAATVWSTGFDQAVVSLSADAVADMLGGRPPQPAHLVTGRPGAYLRRGHVSVPVGGSVSWSTVADTGLDHAGLTELMRTVGAADATHAADLLVDDIDRGTERLRELLAGADAFQHTGDAVADAHHLSNVLFNCMRGGVFPFGDDVPTADLARFVMQRNSTVGDRHRSWFDTLDDLVDERELRDAAAATGDPDLERLVLEYLPLTFSRRHGDPSRPWNRFAIDVRDEHGERRLTYEGNWRDIFQNWEALLQSSPTWFPNVIATFLDATTIEGYNPYRISRDGIDWEVPDPHDPWSHIGYWGDHQIVYLLRLVEMWERYEPGALAAWSDDERFVHAEVPYRLADHDAIVADPRDTITYDVEQAEAIARRVAQVGADGRLLTDREGRVVHVGVFEKLLIPALTKLSNYVPDGGIWLNTQRPEWNDANNALAGPGLSMVTLAYLRRYLAMLRSRATAWPTDVVPVTATVATWLDEVARVFAETEPGPMDDTDRRAVVDRLGRAFEAHRHRVRAGDVATTTDLLVTDVVRLCDGAIGHLDACIAGSRRPDGLHHSYNRVSFPTSDTASVHHLGPMLEGQVAMLSSGALDSEAALALVDALYASDMYRVDLDTFMLYPVPPLAPFWERNRLTDHDVARIGNVRPEVLDSVIVTASDGARHIRSTIANAKALTQVLDTVGATDDERRTLLEVHESVVDHDAFTGRSGRMHGYEGIGSVYWHMVAKLLVAVQELYLDACRNGGSDDELQRLSCAYRCVQHGFGYHKSPSEYGAIPIDCYSHSPAHSGAQQPGMTGQVKEEILARLGELGLHVADGCITLTPGVLDPDEVLGADGASSARATVCTVPIVIERGAADTVEVVRNGERRRFDGGTLPAEDSSEVFARSSAIDEVRWTIGEATWQRWRHLSSLDA